MLFQEYFDIISKSYSTVSVLADKNGGTVIRLRNKQIKRDMILKKYISPVPAYDFLKNIRHRNLPEVYDAVTLEDAAVVLEEYVDGVTVAQVLESGLYTYHGAKKILLGVCSALITLHGMGIIHRDIKPENVMIDTLGTVKLIDLGASRRYDPNRSRDTEVLGTIGYASPEQMGIAQCDERTDIYAMGVLLNVMLTGEHPSKKLAKGRAGRIVLKCTQIDPDSRYQSVEKLMRAI